MLLAEENLQVMENLKVKIFYCIVCEIQYNYDFMRNLLDTKNK